MWTCFDTLTEIDSCCLFVFCFFNQWPCFLTKSMTFLFCVCIISLYLLITVMISARSLLLTLSSSPWSSISLFWIIDFVNSFLIISFVFSFLYFLVWQKPIKKSLTSKPSRIRLLLKTDFKNQPLRILGGYLYPYKL